MKEHRGESKNDASRKTLGDTVKTFWEVISKNQAETTLVSATQWRQMKGKSLWWNNLASLTAILAEFLTTKQ